MPLPPSQIVALSLVQGATEFLPISSSAHAILFSTFFGAGHAISLDIALHFGSLIALLCYLRKDVRMLVSGLGDCLRRQWTSKPARTLIRLMIASLPLALLGGLLAATQGLESLPRSTNAIAGSTILFALLLLLAERGGKTPEKTLDSLPLLSALAIGCLQCCALLPGASRAGVVMTAGFALKMPHREAARLALLTAIPTLGGASVLGAVQLLQDNTTTPQLLQQSGLAAVCAFAAALVALLLFMRFIARIGVLPFVLYRLLLGALLLLAL